MKLVSNDLVSAMSKNLTKIKGNLDEPARIVTYEEYLDSDDKDIISEKILYIFSF